MKLAGISAGTNGFAFVGVGAIAEAFLVHLPDHAQDAAMALRLTLRQKCEVRNFCRGKKHGGGIRTGRGTRAAPDAGGRFHREVGVVFGNRDRICLRRGAGPRADESARLHDAIEGGAIDDQILHDRERAGAERLDRNRLAILELAHVKLAGGGGMGRSVGFAVDR